jgi:hypothetical protein
MPTAPNSGALRIAPSATPARAATRLLRVESVFIANGEQDGVLE